MHIYTYNKHINLSNRNTYCSIREKYFSHIINYDKMHIRDLIKDL